VETRASKSSPSSFLASQPPTLYAASIDSYPRRLMANHNPPINRMIGRSMMMNLKIIRIMRVMKIMTRMIRTKKLRMTSKKRLR
jgi:hypothetical protein